MIDLWMLVSVGIGLLGATFLAGVVGFAGALVALPLLLVLGLPLPHIVVINLTVGLTTRSLVVARRHADIDMIRSSLLVLGSLPGICLGLLVREHVPAQYVRLSAALLTLAAATALAVRRSSGSPSRPRRQSVLAAGASGGFLGVTTSLNGVPPALLLTRDSASARSMVADLAAYFAIGNSLTLGAIVLFGQGPPPEVWWALLLWLPIGLVGQSLGMKAGPKLPYRRFRQITIAVIMASGTASALQALPSVL